MKFFLLYILIFSPVTWADSWSNWPPNRDYNLLPNGKGIFYHPGLENIIKNAATRKQIDNPKISFTLASQKHLISCENFNFQIAQMHRLTDMYTDIANSKPDSIGDLESLNILIKQLGMPFQIYYRNPIYRVKIAWTLTNLQRLEITKSPMLLELPNQLIFSGGNSSDLVDLLDLNTNQFQIQFDITLADICSQKQISLKSFTNCDATKYSEVLNCLNPEILELNSSLNLLKDNYDSLRTQEQKIVNAPSNNLFDDFYPRFKLHNCNIEVDKFTVEDNKLNTAILGYHVYVKDNKSGNTTNWIFYENEILESERPGSFFIENDYYLKNVHYHNRFDVRRDLNNYIRSLDIIESRYLPFETFRRVRCRNDH